MTAPFSEILSAFESARMVALASVYFGTQCLVGRCRHSFVLRVKGCCTVACNYDGLGRLQRVAIRKRTEFLVFQIPDKALARRSGALWAQTSYFPAQIVPK